MPVFLISGGFNIYQRKQLWIGKSDHVEKI